jgi:SNF2 family DNA or RNA helicase
MGTGKTRAAIELIAAYRFATVLIICPHTVVSVWPEQIQRWSSVPMRVLALDKGTVKRRTQLAQQHLDELARDPSPHILVINSEAARADEFAVFALKRAWDLVILDESHRIKDPHGYTAKFAGLLGRRATCRLALTDTPMPHSPLDVYAQFRFVDPSVYGVSWMRFRARYAVMGGFNGKEVVGYRHLDEPLRKFYALAYRVQAEDVLDLPEQIFVTRTATMTGHGASTYRRLERDLIAEVDEGVVTVANALTKLLRLAQVTSGFVRDDDGREHDIDDAKATLLAEVLDELAPHEPVVAFARFHHDLDTIATIARAQGRTVAELSGRVNELALWQAGQRDVLAAQIQSGKEGVDLTRARYTIYYSLGYSLGDYEQSLKRTHRPGQRRAVTYVHLVVKDTVDVHVLRALEQRKEIIETVLEQLSTTAHAQLAMSAPVW